VLDNEAEAYQQLLKGESSVQFRFETNPKTKTRCDALLARPDFAAQYLQGISSLPLWIQSTWAGIEPLIAPLNKRPEILLTGLKNIFGPLIAEYTFNYLLEHVRQSETYKGNQKKGFWPLNNETPGTLQNLTLCIIGSGSIGCHVAKVAQVFGMNVIGVSRRIPTRKQIDNTDLVHFGEISQDMKYAVSKADFVLACLPDTATTKNIINKSVFSAMKNSAIIINVGRGASLNLDDLLTALRTGQISSAILDVLPDEPLASDSPLWQEPKLSITPHIAAASTPRDVAELFLDNLVRINTNQTLMFEIDINQGY